MSMSLDQVVKVIEEFSELQRKECTKNRVSYSYPGSPIKRKNVIQELYLTGNGYLFVGYLPEFHKQMDKNRLINIKSMTRDELRISIRKVIQSFHSSSEM